jgi:hypothetical protein
MAFDIGRYMAEDFKPRTKAVPVPELADWFEKGDEVVWTVRGLTGIELARANDVAAKRSLSMAILEGLLTMKAADVKEAIIKLTGRGDDIPEKVALQVEHLVMASVDPVCSEDLALKLNKVAPTVFLSLCQNILILSGQGMSPGKSKPFGETKKSKAH